MRSSPQSRTLSASRKSPAGGRRPFALASSSSARQPARRGLRGQPRRRGAPSTSSSTRTSTTSARTPAATARRRRRPRRGARRSRPSPRRLALSRRDPPRPGAIPSDLERSHAIPGDPTRSDAIPAIRSAAAPVVVTDAHEALPSHTDSGSPRATPGCLATWTEESAPEESARGVGGRDVCGRTFESVDRGRLARITNRSRRRSTPRRTRETRTSAHRLKSRALARFARTVAILKSQPLGISYCKRTDGPVLAANGAVVRRWFFFARNPWWGGGGRGRRRASRGRAGFEARREFKPRRADV